MLGRILDASSLDAVVIADVDASMWLENAYATSTPIYLPQLAVSEVRSLRPELLDVIDDVLDHPAIIRRDPDADIRPAILELLGSTATYDVGSAHAIVVSRTRGWPVITGDVGRLRRLDPDVEVLLL